MDTAIVGVDGSPGGDRALAWALEWAASRNGKVEVFHGYRPSLPGSESQEPDVARASAERVVESALARHDIPEGVAVERSILEVGRGGAAAALIEASARVSVLVVGSRGLGGFTGLLVGSVSQQCVDHATCPVVVIPPPERDAA